MEWVKGAPFYSGLFLFYMGNGEFVVGSAEENDDGWYWTNRQYGEVLGEIPEFYFEIKEPPSDTSIESDEG